MGSSLLIWHPTNVGHRADYSTFCIGRCAAVNIRYTDVWDRLAHVFAREDLCLEQEEVDMLARWPADMKLPALSHLARMGLETSASGSPAFSAGCDGGAAM